MNHQRMLVALTILFAVSLVDADIASARTVGTSHIAKLSAPSGKCKMRKVATTFDSRKTIAHIMSITSVHWWTNGGFVQGAHDQFLWENDTDKARIFDEVLISATSAEQSVHMKSFHLASFCTGRRYVDWEAKSSASKDC